MEWYIFFSINFCNFIVSTMNMQTRARVLKAETEIIQFINFLDKYTD